MVVGDEASTPAEQTALDATPFIDPDGTHWMVYAHEWAQIQDGTYLAVKMKNDWSARIGEPVLLFKASQGPWVRPHPRADTFVTDGPFFHRMKNGKLAMVWSSFVKGHGYGMGRAISESGTIAGPWRHAEKPFFGGDGEDGGHAMVFRDFSGELLMALHQPNGGNRERAKIFRLKEDGDLLVVDGPWTPKAEQNAVAPATETPQQRDARMAWWREARFGMFVHWGLYSGLAGNWDGKSQGANGDMEWMQNRVGVDTKTYADAALPKFQPVPGFAKAWAKLAKQAGCQYVVFTTKHHEGFSLQDSKFSDFDAGDHLNRDLVKEITDALRAEGLRVGFYHSVIDWHHPDYDFQKAKGLPYPTEAAKLATAPRDHSRYIDFLHNQTEELTKNYGPVDILWWDFSSKEFQGDDAWRSCELIKKVRANQPGIIMNNRLYRIPEAGFTGPGTGDVVNRIDPQYGDFVTPEQHIPPNGLPGVDWETCMTLNTTWGYNEHDSSWKSPRDIIRNLIDIASKGGNYLLNIGPKGDGTIPEETVTCLTEVGKWMDVNAEAIRGTTATPLPSLPWGRCTMKKHKVGTTLYLHVFDWPKEGELLVPGLENEIQSATLLANGKELEFEKTAAGLEIELPAQAPDPNATIIKLEITGASLLVPSVMLHAENAAPAPAKPLRILCVGDSITAGYTDNPTWDVPFEFGYRQGLFERLQKAGYQFQFVGDSPEPWDGRFGLPKNSPSPDLRAIGQDRHEGHGGWNTAQVLQHIDQWIAKSQPDIVLLMIGINDAGKPPAAENLKGIVEKIVAARPQAHVVVAQITPRSEFTQSIADYNTSIRTTLVPEFQRQGGKVTTVDQYRNMLKPDGTIDPELFSNKINHPNATAYDRMAQTWFEAIQTIFPPIKK